MRRWLGLTFCAAIPGDTTYIGSTTNLERRLKEHRHGQTHSTKRLGDNLEIAAAVELATIDEARALEREMKRKKNPRLALASLQSRLR